MAQIYCFLLFGFDSKKILKMIDVVYKHHAVVYVQVFLMLWINLRLVGLNIYFYDVFF